MIDTAIDALASAARLWRDPAYPARAEAVERTLDSDNRFTGEALAFSINQQISTLQPGPMRAWSRASENASTVGVMGAGNVPMAALQDYVAILLSGHAFVGHVSAKSPYLLPAFAGSVAEQGGPAAHFVSRDQVFDGADALIATGTQETALAIEARCDQVGIRPERRLIRANRYSVAVIDGRESEDERIGLAEDMLLHEGLGCRNVAMVFAPEDLSPDDILDAMAVFRGTFPAHPSTSGSLKMQEAFLKAVGTPHAFGEGLEFLLSRGTAEVQPPGHVRWVVVPDRAAAVDWAANHAEHLQVVVARRGLELPGLPDNLRCDMGLSQRPELDWQPDGRDTMSFLAGL